MKIRIAVTVCDCSPVVHTGGDPVRVTQIIELSESQIPPILAKHLASENSYETVSLSIIKENNHVV